MKRISMIVVLVLILFVSQAVLNVSAGPLNSFAENPIPYWDDDSSDVGLTWSETEQTVTAEWANDSLYLENGTDATEWVELGCEADDNHSSDGTSIVLELNNAVNPDWDNFYTNEPETLITDTHLEIKIKRNVSRTIYIKWYTADSKGGAWTSKTITPVVGEWTIYTYQLEQTVECFEVYASTTTADMKVEIDYIRIYELGDLDISVPIIPQDTQEIEVYVNSTNLNSEVRLELYDNDEALDTYCTFNSTHIIFPDLEYAQTNGLSRIQFSLDNARMIGTITVFDEDSILINQYNDTSLISGTTFLRMNDSVFNGSFILIYLNGDTTYSAELSIIEELFLSTNMIGYFGPLALVVIGYLITKKNKELGIFMIIVDSLIIWQYFALIETTPDYWWQVIILLLGVVLCAIQMMDR